jgi:predicted Zn-dependent protease
MSAPRSLRLAARHLTRGECEDIARRALRFAAADETRVTISSGQQGNTRFAVNQISTAGDTYNASVSVQSSFGMRTGGATTNRLEDGSLRDAVQMAERLARLSPEDPEALPLPGPQQFPEAPGWSESTASLEPTERATAVQLIADPARRANLISTGYLEANAGAFAVANSRGLFAYHRSTSCALTTTVRTPDGTGSGWAGGAHFDWSRLDPAAFGTRAIDKAKLSRSPVAIEPGRYTVILEPTAVGNLVQLIAGALGARAADEGRSFFSRSGGGNKVGLKVVDERVTLLSDPLDPDAPAAPFTPEGLPLSRTVWIENGVVRNLAYDRYWAQRQSRTPSATGGTLRMSGGSASIEEMIASTRRGLLITRFWYIRGVDARTILYTGLTRDGTFLVENGKITRAVKNLRFNESPIFMLNNIEAMGAPVRVSASEAGGPGTAIVVPPLKIRDFTFTSLSDAI